MTTLNAPSPSPTQEPSVFSDFALLAIMVAWLLVFLGFIVLCDRLVR
jgi:hypothetical protein